MKTPLKLSLVAATVTAIIYMVAVIAFNLWLPIGFHVSAACFKEYAKFDQAKILSANILIFHRLSRFIATAHKNKCDIPHLDNGERNPGINGRLVFLVSVYGDAEFDKEFVSKMLIETLKHCSPDGETADPADWSPLMASITLRHKDLVGLFLNSNASTYRKLVKPGKPIDGMNALEYSRYLEAKATDRVSQQAYGEISRIIELHNETRAFAPGAP